MLLAWFRSEIAPYGTLGKYSRLMQFMDTQLRQDLKNVGVYIWTNQVKQAYGCGQEDDFHLRLLLYFVERKYLAPDELPALLRAVQSRRESFNEAMLALIRKLVVVKAGFDPSKPLDEPLAFLATPASLIDSLNVFLRTTPEYRALMAKWQRDKRQMPKDEPTEPPEPTDILEPILTDLIGTSFGWSDASSVTVKLHLPEAPVYTNTGPAEDQPGVYIWSSPLPERSPERQTGLPPFCYAIWAEADVEFQRRHFGRIVLEGKDLVQYCLWHAGLSESQRRQWDEFARSVTPAENLSQRLKAFRFEEENAPAEGQAEPFESHAETITSAIIKALEQPRDEPAATVPPSP